METRSRGFTILNQQENIYGLKNKTQNIVKGVPQNSLIKRTALGDINSNVRLQPVQKGKAHIINNEVEKQTVKLTRPVTRSRSYKNVTAKVDTRHIPSKVSSVNIKANAEDQSKISKNNNTALTNKTGSITVRLRQTKISSSFKSSSSSQESLPSKESVGIKPQQTVAVKTNGCSVIKKEVEIKETKTTISNIFKRELTKRETKSEAYSTELLDGVEDIDSGHGNSPILMGIYIKDIYNYLMELELEYPIKKNHLDGQVYMTSKMRTMLIDWLVQVHEQFKLMLETLHLTVAIIDRYLQIVKTVQRKQIQLVGITAMFIASKYEEMFLPDIQDFLYITDNSYSKSEIIKCERAILLELNFCLGRPLPLHFERRFIKAAKVAAKNHHLAKYFVDLCLVEYDMAHYRPSEIAAAAVCLSISVLSPDTLPRKCWTPTLAYYSGYKYEEISDIVKKLASVVTSAPTSHYNAVLSKYNSSRYGKVPSFPELRGDMIKRIASESSTIVLE